MVPAPSPTGHQHNYFQALYQISSTTALFNDTITLVSLEFESNGIVSFWTPASLNSSSANLKKFILVSQVRVPSETRTSSALLCTPKCSMITWSSGTSLAQLMGFPPGSSSLALRLARSSRWPSSLVKCWTLKFWQSVIYTLTDKEKFSVRWTDSCGRWW